MPSEQLWTDAHYQLNSALKTFEIAKKRPSVYQKQCINTLMMCLDAIVDEELLPLIRGWGLWSEANPCELRIILSSINKVTDHYQETENSGLRLEKLGSSEH